MSTVVGAHGIPVRVGDVGSLEDDFFNIMTSLGYEIPAGASLNDIGRHCITSCWGVNNSIGESHRLDPQVDIKYWNGWYDAESAAMLQKVYQADFNAFGYSRDPTRMYD